MNMLGYDLGDFEIQLESAQVCAGDTLYGRFCFRFNRPTEARKVAVQLRAVEKELHRERDPRDWDRYNETVIEREVFERTLYLDFQRIYDSGSYPFEFFLPERVPPTCPLYDSSFLGQASRVLDFASESIPNYRVEWLLTAWIDVPFGGDPSREVLVTVFPPSAHRQERPSDHRPTYPEPSATMAPPTPSRCPQPSVAPSPTPAGPLAATESVPRFCRHCGAPSSKAGARFCGSCGQSQL